MIETFKISLCPQSTDNLIKLIINKELNAIATYSKKGRRLIIDLKKPDECSESIFNDNTIEIIISETLKENNIKKLNTFKNNTTNPLQKLRLFKLINKNRPTNRYNITINTLINITTIRNNRIIYQEYS